MSRYSEMSIAVQTLMAANPIVDPLANVIEDEHLEMHYDYLCDQGYDEDFLKVIDSDVYRPFWENLAENFVEFFLDNGIAVSTFDNDDYHLLTPTEQAMVTRRFATAMLEDAKKEIQQRIDMAIVGREL